MRQGKLQRSAFAVSFLVHAALLFPLATQKMHEPETTQTSITFSLQASSATKQQQKKPEPKPEPKPEKKQPKPVLKQKKAIRKAEPVEHQQARDTGDTPPLARQETAALNSPSEQPQATPAAQSSRYLTLVRNLIERRKHYPGFARSQRQEGTVLIRLGIGTRGEITALSLLNSSGHPALDRAALEAVRKAQPFPPPPQYGLGAMSIDIPMLYKLL